MAERTLSSSACSRNEPPRTMVTVPGSGSTTRRKSTSSDCAERTATLGMVSAIVSGTRMS